MRELLITLTLKTWSYIFSFKTEFMIIGTSQQLAKVSINSLRVGTATITPVSSARNLGSWFDSKLTMAIHVSKTCNSAFYYLYNLRRIRKYLSKDNTKTLIHAFISSRVDYCNSLFMACQGINSLSYSVCRTCVLD